MPLYPQVGQWGTGGFQPSGRFGMGGSSLPVPSGAMNPQTRAATMAAMYSPSQSAMRRPPAQGMIAGYRPEIAGPGGMGRQLGPPGGVNPGQAPQMNAVEQARMNMPQRPPIGPGDAALAGYMNGR